MMRKNSLLAAAAAALAWTVGAEAPATAEDRAPAPIAQEDRVRYAKSCGTYANRARFLPRDGAAGFVVTMAEACEAAQRSLDAAPGPERSSAIAYLERLVHLRDTVIAINMDRLYGKGAMPFAKPVAGEGRFVSFAEVSETGEFLIAHRMGLLDAFDDWRATEPDAATARALGARLR